MFNKDNNKIIILIHENVMFYPPALNLMECLLNNGYKVHFIGCGQEKLPKTIKDSNLFSSSGIVIGSNNNLLSRITNRFKVDKSFKNVLERNANDDDIIWTINPRIVRTLGKNLQKYSDRHVMELMELLGDFYPLFNGDKHIGFDLKKYARNARTVVVPERNRAYIQKATWGLKKLPYILPNKPYYFSLEQPLTEEMNVVAEKMSQEKRKIIIYLGVFDPDRTFEDFAKAVEEIKDEYCIYMFGKCAPDFKKKLDEFCNKYSCLEYMGFFNPPMHLCFLKYAYIALLPYLPGKSIGGTSTINALFCAPNKIFEYAGAKIPMIGTDVLGLSEPFEKYNIGVCCKDLNSDTIIKAIKTVDKEHKTMSNNCVKYFESVNLDDIINQIVNDQLF